MRDASEGDERNPVMSGREVLVRVVVGLVRGIVAGSLRLSKSYGKTSNTVFHSFSSYF